MTVAFGQAKLESSAFTTLIGVKVLRHPPTSCRSSQLLGLKPGQGRDHRLLNAAFDVEHFRS
jgi:hypothetical protein